MNPADFKLANDSTTFIIPGKPTDPTLPTAATSTATRQAPPAPPDYFTLLENQGLFNNRVIMTKRKFYLAGLLLLLGLTTNDIQLMLRTLTFLTLNKLDATLVCTLFHC